MMRFLVTTGNIPAKLFLNYAYTNLLLGRKITYYFLCNAALYPIKEIFRKTNSFTFFLIVFDLSLMLTAK